MRSGSLVRIVFPVTALALTLVVASGCDDSDESSVDDTSADTSTSDATGTDDTTGDTGLDAVDAQDTQAPQDTSDTDTMRAGLEEPCAEHLDCQRGLICGGLCVESVGCASSTMDAPGEGCLIEERDGGMLTAAECESDADCANSAYGATCIRHVCSDLTPCADDSACTAPETCYQAQVCLP